MTGVLDDSFVVVVHDTIVRNGQSYLSIGVDSLYPGYYRLDDQGNVFQYFPGYSSEVLIYNFQVAEGDTYEVSIGDSLDATNWIVTVESRDDTVTVPAGTFFPCIRFFFDDPNSFDEERSVTCALGVGRIKWGNVWYSNFLYRATIAGKDYPLEMENSGSLAFYPAQFNLSQNYPNPFNPVTTLRFDLPQASDISLTVYDIRGRQVAQLGNAYIEAGQHQVQWDGGGFSSGIYIAWLVTPEYTKSIKMLLLK
ncbi:T9SS type A sorting domain-containing protein [Candidatus Neomarinimicrobiota bacterium]